MSGAQCHKTTQKSHLSKGIVSKYYICLKLKSPYEQYFCKSFKVLESGNKCTSVSKVQVKVKSCIDLCVGYIQYCILWVARLST